MSGFTEYGAAQLSLGTSLPQTFYAKLHTGDPGVDALLNAAVETDRQTVVLTTDVYDVFDRVSNAVVTWIGVAATEIATHASLWDAVTLGNPWIIGEIGIPLDLTLGGNGTIGSGLIRLRINRHGD